MKKHILFLMLGFITPGWALSCSAPVTLSEINEMNGSPRVTLNERGEAAVIWKALTDGENFFLSAATRDKEKKWSAPARLGDFEESIESSELYMDDEGNAFAGWFCVRDQGPFYKFSKKKKEDWCPAITVASFEDLIVPYAANFDLQGDSIVLGAPLGETSQAHVIHYHQATAVKNHIRPLNSKAFPLQLIRGKNGQMNAFYAVPHKDWLYRETDTDLLQLKLNEKGQWSAPTTLCKMGIAESFPKRISHFFSSMNSKENLAVIWLGWNKDNSDNVIEAVVSLDSYQTAPVTIAASKTGFCSTKIILDDQDNALAVWIGLLKNRKGIFAAYKPKGQPWSSPVPLSNSQKHADSFDLSQDYQGHFVVVWGEFSLRSGQSIYGATLSTQNQEWSLALLSPPDQDCLHPSVAFNEKGEGIIAWSKRSWDKKQFSIEAAELKMD